MPSSTTPPDNQGATETRSVAAAPSARPAFAVLVSCAGGVGLVPLGDRSEVTIGRVPECDVVVADPSVSRTHARLRLTGETTIQDLGSRNGTTVQGRRAMGDERLPVGIGTVIELGSATLVIQSARELASYARAPSADAPKKRPSDDPNGPILADPTMQRLYALLDVIAPTTLSVLILGETGAGKEVFAEAVHHGSPRASQSFLRLNCAALPESILEGELFGYEKGAFTGATQAKPGLFESADGGTVFLDEIGEMPLATQAKLLRLLESGEVMRLGSVKPKIVDVRIISATNRDPRRLIGAGTFRADLYFRINGISVTLPPLRKRRADILPLAKRFIDRAAAQLGRAAPLLGADAMRALESHDWPGNVRELRNVLDRAVVLCRSGTLDVEHLLLVDEEAFTDEPLSGTIRSMPASPTSTPSVWPPSTPSVPPESAAHAGRLRDQVDAFERQRVLDALAKTNGNQGKAAQLLGVSRRTLINKIEAYAIERPRKGKK